MNAHHLKQLEGLLDNAYSLKREILKSHGVASSPTERRSLELELEKCNENIKQLEAELGINLNSPAAQANSSEESTTQTTATPSTDAPELEKIRSDRAISGNYSDAVDAEQATRFGQAVCLVEAQGYGGELGTGFLVAPNLILTNYHVVDAVGAIGDLQQKAAKLAFRFGYRGSGTSIKLGQLIKVKQKQPLLVSSEPEKLDYALLQLEQPACDESGNALVPLTIIFDRLLRKEDSIWIVQHPLGGTLRFAQGRISQVDQQRHRFEYNTNTEPGSSGSPVFDRYWNLVGLHHSGTPYPAKTGKDIGNEGLLLSAIWPEIQTLVEKANPPSPSNDPTPLATHTKSGQFYNAEESSQNTPLVDSLPSVSLTPSQRQALEWELNTLKQQCDILRKTIGRIGNNLVIEVNPTIQVQLEMQLEEWKHKLAPLEARLIEVEKQLN